MRRGCQNGYRKTVDETIRKTGCTFDYKNGFSTAPISTVEKLLQADIFCEPERAAEDIVLHIQPELDLAEAGRRLTCKE